MTPYEAGQIDAKAGEFDPDESYSLDQTIEYQRGFDAERAARAVVYRLTLNQYCYPAVTVHVTAEQIETPEFWNSKPATDAAFAVIGNVAGYRVDQIEILPCNPNAQSGNCLYREVVVTGRGLGSGEGHALSGVHPATRRRTMGYLYVSPPNSRRASDGRVLDSHPLASGPAIVHTAPLMPRRPPCQNGMNLKQ